MIQIRVKPEIITMRTPENEESYQESMKNQPDGYCYLCNADRKKEFKYWSIVPNQFPYDTVAEVHDMITLNNHSNDSGGEIKEELEKIKEEIGGDYDVVFENKPVNRTIPGHRHLHIIKFRNFEEGVAAMSDDFDILDI